MKVHPQKAPSKVSSPDGQSRTHSITLATNPAAPKVGREASVTIAVNDAAGKPATRFADLHTKPMHLIAVSEDLTDFHHVHPTATSAGTFEAKLALKKESSYRLWTEVQPQGARTALLESNDVATAGAKATPAQLVVDSDKVKIVGDVHATLAGGAVLKANQSATLQITLADHASGRPLDLEPLLGAGGHAIVISEDRGHFSHEHGSVTGGASPAPAPAGGHGGHSGGTPAVNGSSVAFDVTFPSPGRYRVFFQTQAKGEVITVPYTVDVR